MPDRKNPHFENALTPEERRERRRLEIQRNKAARDRADAVVHGFIIIPFLLLIASGLLWLTAQIWIHMPW